MVETCVGFYKNNSKFLFIYRNKKKNDWNKGKYLGIGGHLEAKEDPDSAMKREFKEETGLDIVELKKLGTVLFKCELNSFEDNLMHVYYIDKVQGEMIDDCNEGILEYHSPEEFFSLPHWESDDIWIRKVFVAEKFGDLLCKCQGNRVLSIDTIER